ncbi:MAG: hypothetical protein HXY27_00050 [Hydrogenophilaceae bacterium]|nr:hypothetical protein [Hydrogenophilaceae bacterium]
MDETGISSLDKFTASPYRQEIELQHVEHRADYVTMRVRIRELKRFTIFDIDPITAKRWGQAMLEWASRHEAKSGAGDEGEPK